MRSLSNGIQLMDQGDRYRWLRRSGIRRRLMVWGLALLGFAVALSTIASSIYSRKEIQQASAQLQTEIASATARQIHSFITRKVERLQDTTLGMSLYPFGGDEQRLLGQLLLKNDPSLREVSVLDHQGKETLKLSERAIFLASDFRDQATTPPFVEAIQGRVYFGPVRTSTRAEPYLTMAIPIKPSPARTIGVLVAQIDLKFLWEEIAGAKFGRGGYAYLVNETGLLIAHPDPSLVLKSIPLDRLQKVGRFLSTHSADTSPGKEVKGISGTLVLSTYAPVQDLGWAVVVEEPVELALAGLKRLQRFAFLLLVVGLLLSAATMVWVSQKITKPIQELREGVATIGAGNLEHRANIKTGDEIEELANEFNKMTNALQTSYSTLEEKVAQRTKEISALYEVTTAVNQSLALQDILEAVIAKIAEIFAFQSTRIFLFNDGMEELELRASFEVGAEHSIAARTFKRGQGIVGLVAESAEPMIFEDIRTDPRYAALSATRSKYSAKLCFFAVYPIKTQSRVFGAILFNGRSPRKLTRDETRLLTSMCEHLAVAVEKASLFRQSETRSQQLSVLNTIGAAVSQSLDLETVLKEAIEKMIETLNFDASWIYILDPTEQELRLKAHKGLAKEVARSMDRRNLSAGISGKIFETGTRLVFEDLQDDLKYKQLSHRNKVGSLGFASAAGFPIKAKEKVIGVLHLANKARHHFASDELQLIESIAQEIGVAAENARLFEQVNQKTAALGQMNRELEQANRAKSEFISAMSHELRTPLNVIMGNAELTGSGFFGDITPEQKKSMTQIQHHSKFLLKLVNDVLALSRLDAKQMSIELATVDIAEVINHVQSQAEQLNRLNRLQVGWDVERDLPAIVTDVTKLEEILQNLIGNAFKFTPQGRIDVRVRNIPELNRIEFTVADTGIGIEAQDMDRIFSAFEQLQEAHTGDFNGVGLGLNIVKKYLELMKGDIRVESQPGEGSTFTFSVPHSVALHS
jgi:signal transduction histidine kinase/HAMP domain-containing protein